jgi:hypothetical protein
MNDQKLTVYMGVQDGPDTTVGIELSDSTLTFKEDTTRAQWREVGIMLAKASNASTRWIASWRRFGAVKFGEDVVELESGQLLFPSMALAQAKQLEMLPEEVFEMGISPQHAKVLSEECSGPADISRWAKTALKENLTAGELRASIADGRIVRRSDGESKGGGSLPTVHGVRGLFDRWASQTLKERPLEEWQADDLKALLDELKPIYLICERAAGLWKSSRTGGVQ